MLFRSRCGLHGADAAERFTARHEQVRSEVRAIAARHFLAGTPEQEAVLALLASGEADARLAARVLAPAGFRDVVAACARVRELAREPFFVLSRSRTERALAAVLPMVLERCATAPDPDRALHNLARIVAAVGGRAVFYELWRTRPAVRDLFCDLAGWSEFLVDLFAEFPGLPDEVADALNQGRRPLSALDAEAVALAQGLADPLPPLAMLRARETAAAAVHDLQGEDQDRVAAHLSRTAEAIVRAALPRLVAARAREHGVPTESGRPTRACVLAPARASCHRN